MPYGLQVLTSTGVKNTFDLNTARIVNFYNATSISGSANIPEFDSAKGDFMFITGSYGAIGQKLTWNNTSKIISWGKHASSIPNTAYSSNFFIAFFHYK